MIAAEHDYTPLAEKQATAALLHADMRVVTGSRHGTPFDAAAATNAGLLAMLTDQALPSADHWICDAPQVAPELEFTGSLSAQHALGPVA
jgi:hypothetical protein